jgi:hypothetical protein
MAGNDVPLDVLLDRTVQQLEHTEALSDKQLVLLKKSKLYFDWFVFEYETDHIEGFDLLMSELKEAIDA